MICDPTRFDWFNTFGDHDPAIPHERDPRDHPWGMFVRDATGDVAVGMFSWFSTREELASFIETVEPMIYELEGEELESFWSGTADAIAGLADPDEDAEAAREAINTAQEHFRVEWLGRFEQLHRGGGEFARELRTRLREDDGDEGEDLSRPLAEDELDGFIALIADHGS